MSGWIQPESPAADGSTGEGRVGSQAMKLPTSLLWLACFIAASIAAMGLGQGLKLIPGVEVTFWPPAGIFVAALLLTRLSTWPCWIAAACAAEFAGNAIWFHNPGWLALGYFSANTGVAVTAALLVRWAVARVSVPVTAHELESPRNALLFILLAGGLAPIISATTFAAIDVSLGKPALWTTWRLVWLGDGMGLLLAAPLTLAVVQLWQQRGRIAFQPAAEFIGTCGFALLVIVLALQGHVTAIYLALPAVVWAAVRFRVLGAFVVLSAVFVTVAALTRFGSTAVPATPEAMAERVITLQVFLGVCASTALIVAGLSALNARAHEELRSANESLERRVHERTRALQESEERFRLSLRGSRIILTRCDRELRYMWIHHPHPDFERADIIGKRDTEIVDNEATRAVERLKRRVLETRAETEAEITFPFKDGPQTYHIRAEPRLDASGAVEAIITIGVDITERKRAEEIVRKSEDRFKAMANAAPAILWVTNPDASLTYLSRAWQEYTGQTEAQSMGSDGFGWLDAVHPEDRAASSRIFLEANRTRTAFSLDYRIRRADGEYRWAIDMGRPRFDESGGFLGYVGSVTDVHVRVLAEAARRRHAETFARLVEDSPLGIYTVDEDFRIRHISKGALTAFCSVRPLIGRDFGEVVRITWPEPLAAEVIAVFRRTLETGEAYVSPGITAARHDLRAIESYEWETNRITLDDGRPGVVCYFFDSTRLQAAKEIIACHAAELDMALAERTLEVRRAEKAATTSERMAAVGTFAAGLAHDMSNLLLPLGMRLEAMSSGKWLRATQPPPDVSEDVRAELRVLSALLDHLRALARNLSLFSRDPSREGSGERVNIGHWCQQASRLIDASIGPSIVIKWDCPESFQEAAVAPHRLTQAVQNLIHNARDAIVTKSLGAEPGRGGMPIGRITVVARATDDSRFMNLTVSDDGAGMNEEVLRHCREPFYTTKDRLPASGTSPGGSGLGLSLAHQIIEQAGGALHIESTLGVGTRITLRIPVATSGSEKLVEPKASVLPASSPDFAE